MLSGNWPKVTEWKAGVMERIFSQKTLLLISRLGINQFLVDCGGPSVTCSKDLSAY